MSLAFVNGMKMKDGGGPGVTRNWRGDANTWMEMRREARIAEGERGERVARLRYEEIAPRLPRLPLRRLRPPTRENPPVFAPVLSVSAPKYNNCFKGMKVTKGKIVENISARW